MTEPDFRGKSGFPKILDKRRKRGFGLNRKIRSSNFVWNGPKINKDIMFLYHSTKSICPEINLIPKCFRFKEIMIIYQGFLK